MCLEPSGAFTDANANVPARYMVALEKPREREGTHETVRPKHPMSRGERDRVREPARRRAGGLVRRGRRLALGSHETAMRTRPHCELRAQQGELRAREVLTLALAKRGEFRQSRCDAAHAGRAQRREGANRTLAARSAAR